MKKLDYKKYIGSENQLLSYMEGRLSGGKQDGVRFARIDNGKSLSVTVAIERAMDIYQVRYKGININYLAPVGIVSPQYFQKTEEARGFLDNFFVGMLTTIGLQNMGPGKEILGETQGLHGNISNTPPEYYTYERSLDGDTPVIIMKGKMREGRIFGSNLLLERKLTFKYGEDRFILNDTVTNEGFEPRAFVYGLHINFGYPLLEEGTRIILDSEKILARTDQAERYIENWNQIEAPESPYPERCYHHTLKADEAGKASYTVWNPGRKTGFRVSYCKTDLPYFVEWKMLGKGEYVLGLEPMNSFIDGPKIGEEGCEAPVLQPGESRSYQTVFEGIDHI